MYKVFYPDIFYEYKDGFSNGIIDFIINNSSNVNYITGLENEITIWNLGYIDAYNYYQKELDEIGNGVINLNNLFMIINEFYLQRLSQINELTDEKAVAFSLVLKPNDYN